MRPRSLECLLADLEEFVRKHYPLDTLTADAKLARNGYDRGVSGNFTTHSGERSVYHVPGGQFYDKTKPEPRHATTEEARQNECRRSRR
jgi:hypothetical protein